MSESASLLPLNASKQERTLDVAVGLQIEGIPIPIYDLWNPDTCPSQLLPWLAWSLSVDLWDSEWPEDVKRRVIKSSVAVHRRKGTIGSVRDSLGAIGLDAEIVEWSQSTGMAPHTFIIDFDIDNILEAGRQFDSALIKLVVDQVSHTKPVRSHFSIGVREKFEVTAVAQTATATSSLHCERMEFIVAPEEFTTSPSPASGFGLSGMSCENHQFDAGGS